MSLKRRDFLKIVSTSALALPLLDCSSNGYFSSVRDGKWTPKDESWVQSVCQACPGGCGILVRVVDGKAVKIEGNPAHPGNRGALCASGQAGLQLLYNPDRIKGPMKKVESNNSFEWKSITWDEAMDTFVSKLKELKNSSKAHSMAFLNGEHRGMLGEISNRFMTVYGSPNYLFENSQVSVTQAFHMTQGIDSPMAYDFENSNYILSFGSSFLSNWPSPVQSIRAYSYLRQERPGKKAKIIQIEPRFSITASRSDQWIPIEPGTEGLLALGIAYVIIKENFYDEDYVKKFTFGFEDWRDEKGDFHKGFKNLVLESYRSDFVSEATGISVDTIVSLAKDFAVNSPAVALLDENVTNYSNGLYNAMAVHSLNALVGSIDVPGGVLVKRKAPVQELPGISVDETTQKSLLQKRIDNTENGRFPFATSVPSMIPENILADSPYPIEMLLIKNSNPVFSSPNGDAFKQALEKIPFIVSFSSFMDETTQYADLILPDKTYLEKHYYVESPSVTTLPIVAVGKPVLENVFNARPTEDILLDVAQRMGPIFAGQFPWKNSEDFLSFKMESLFDAHKGIVFTDEFEEAQLKLLEDRGWWVPQFSTASEFKNMLLEKGGWWDPSYAFGVRSYVLRTPSRKFEFFSQLFKEKFEKMVQKPGENEVDLTRSNLEALKIEARGDDVFLPHYEVPRTEGEEDEYPFHLYIFKPLNLSNEYHANQPWIQEIIGFHLNISWDSWAEINPETAAELEIEDGELVWIESASKRVQVMVKVYPGTIPDVVSIPYGLGHKTFGRWAKERGINPMELIGTDVDELTGKPAIFSARVKIYKV
jgi:anaerobic selenocysteine-containing dehydrogenase